MADLEAEMARFEAELSGMASSGPASLASQAPPPPPSSSWPQQPQQQGSAPPPPRPPPPQNWPAASQGSAPFPPPPMLSGPPGPPPQQGQQYLPPPPQLPTAPPSFPQGYPPNPPSYPQQPQYAPDDGGYQIQNANAPTQQTIYAAPSYTTPADVAAGGAAFVQKLAMANLAQHLAGGDPVKQQAAIESVKAALESQGKNKGKKEKKPAMKREAAGEKWWDTTMLEWDENDFRIFVGDMGNEVNDDVLHKAFAKYSTVQKCRIVRDKRSNKTKGYGFVSFSDAVEGAKALREMDGKYIGNRPCKLTKSSWQERNPTQHSTAKRKQDAHSSQKAKRPTIFHK